LLWIIAFSITSLFGQDFIVQGQFYESPSIFIIGGDFLFMPKVKQTKQEKLLQEKYNGIKPICKCGCGQEKNKWASENNYKLLRFWEHDINKNTSQIIETLKKELNLV
jgi:hypothetical protein